MFKEKTIVLMACLFLKTILTAQNYIPNPSFENTNYVQCSFTLPGEFDAEMTNWFSANKSTPDVYSTSVQYSCDNHPYGFITTQRVGTQKPRTGNNLAGLSFLGRGGYEGEFNEYREYMEVKLNSPLTTGKEYYVEGYFSLADESQIAINKFGFALSNTYTYKNDYVVLNNIDVKVVAANPVTDKTNWVKVSGKFIANSNYNYLLIGNFYASDSVTQQTVSSNGHIGLSYYFIDDVSLLSANTIIIKGKNTICADRTEDTAFLAATGDLTNVTFYKWVDSSNVNNVLSTTSELKVKPTVGTTYRLYTNIDTIDYTVNVIPCNVVSSFTVSNDTICSNTQLSITNQSIAASSYQWNFIKGNSINDYQVTSLSNPNSVLNNPLGFNMERDREGNYCGYYTDLAANGTTVNYNRINIGNTITNSPVNSRTINLFSLNNKTPVAMYSDENGAYLFRWYKYSASDYEFDMYDYGNTFLQSASIPYYSNPPQINKPLVAEIVRDGNTYFMFVIDSANILYRYNFGNSLANKNFTKYSIAGISINQAKDIKFIKENNNWYAFVLNENSSTITKLGFGNALKNTPTVLSTFNSGIAGTEITTLKECNYYSLLITSGNNIYKFDFKNGLQNQPLPKYVIFSNPVWKNITYTSKIFSENTDKYFFAVGNNMSNQATLYRIKLSIKNNSNIPVSYNETPTNVSFDSAGLYTIVLTAIQSSSVTEQSCKEIMVGTSRQPENIYQQHDSLFTNSIAAAYLWYKNGTYLTTTTVPYLTGVTTVGVRYQVQTLSSNCLSEKSAEFFSVATAINNKSHSIEVKIYPNPGNGIFMINIPDDEEYSMTIYNIIGKEELLPEFNNDKKIKNNTLIDLSVLPKGMYLIRLFNRETSSTYKIEIQ